MSPRENKRFRFGRNWQRYSEGIDGGKIQVATRSIIDLVGTLDGSTFLDVGSGSGLFSLAALGAGAEEILALDYDPDSVETTRHVLEQHAPHDGWTAVRGDVLDRGWIQTLGTWDVVYSWGVLHHTGDMWQACDNVASLVAPRGALVVALYNDQGFKSRVWMVIKWLYVHVWPLRPLLLLLAFAWTWGYPFARDLATGRKETVTRWRDYRSRRGMSIWHDLIDWVGGYPFETARPKEVEDFFRQRDFELARPARVTRSSGTNEFVFQKRSQNR